MGAAPNIEDLQALVATALNADSYLDGLKGSASSVVVTDDGLKNPDIETLLRTRGVAVIVCPILRGEIRDQIDFAGLIDCEIMVNLLINPKQNAVTGSANASMPLLIKKTIQAVIGYPRHAGGERFKMTPQTFELSDFDPGLFGYNLVFKKESRL